MGRENTKVDTADGRGRSQTWNILGITVENVMRNSRRHAAEEGMDGGTRWLGQITAELIVSTVLAVSPTSGSPPSRVTLRFVRGLTFTQHQRPSGPYSPRASSRAFQPDPPILETQIRRC